MSSFVQSSIPLLGERHYITMTPMDEARRANALALGIVVVMLAAACTSPDHRSMNGGGATSPLPARASAGSGPRFAADGPDADDYGGREGYPVKAIFRD